MKGWFLIERADGTEYFVCKKCGHSADVPYDRCPECGGEETMINKAHLRPKDFDNNGDIIPMACKEEKGDRISRSELKKVIERYQIQWNKNCDIDMAKWNCCGTILAIIDNAPTVEPKQGEWTDLSTDGRHTGWIACSVCGQEPPNESNLRTNFCSYCGAKMRKGGADNG